MEEGSVFVAPVKQVTPFNDDAAKGVDTWTTYQGPTKNYGEQVFNVVPYATDSGSTTVMLHNKAGDRGIKIGYDVTQLPHFTLWKNTDTMKEGYVTGLEPGTGYAYNRSVERKFGRVPKLAAGASRSFTLDYTILFGSEDVSAVAREISAIQGQRKTQVDAEPQAQPNKE